MPAYVDLGDNLQAELVEILPRAAVISDQLIADEGAVVVDRQRDRGRCYRWEMHDDFSDYACHRGLR